MASGMMFGASLILIGEGVFNEYDTLSWDSFFNIDPDNSAIRVLLG